MTLDLLMFEIKCYRKIMSFDNAVRRVKAIHRFKINGQIDEAARNVVESGDYTRHYNKTSLRKKG